MGAAGLADGGRIGAHVVGGPVRLPREADSLSSSFSSTNVSKGYLSCHADADCEWSTVSLDGACVAACGACTQVLATTDATTMLAMGTVTIAGGASRASFGFVPAAAGAGYIALDGVTSGFNAK